LSFEFSNETFPVTAKWLIQIKTGNEHVEYFLSCRNLANGKCLFRVREVEKRLIQVMNQLNEMIQQKIGEWPCNWPVWAAITMQRRNNRHKSWITNK
jgi:hypothetical protein